MRSRLERWVLLTGNRYTVASGLLAIMIGVMIVPRLTAFTLRNTTPLTYMASALVTGNITLITIVVAINQVILSQELESPGSLRDEVEETADYRHAALERSPAPTEPSAFLYQLLQQTLRHTRSLQELLPGNTDGASDRLSTDLPDHCERVSDTLEQTSDDLSEVIAPVLGVDYGDYIRDCRRLQVNYDEECRDQLHSTLDQLASDLENLNVARQYFATAFMKEELATLSRSLLYVGVVAVSMPLALLFQLTTDAGSGPPAPGLFDLALLVTVFGLMPLALLIAFVLRIAIVAEYIAGITPFEV